MEAEKKKEATKILINDTKRTLKGFLVEINKINGKNDYSLLQIFNWFLLKEMSIYTELNKLQDSNNILVGLFWCPQNLRAQLNDKVLEIKEQTQVDGPYINLIEKFDDSILVRPTLIQTNEFTMPFQMIVDTYSIPKYKEINPAIFTTVTFPFLFGVMFGDVMHGTILFVFATILCFSKFDPNSSMGMLSQGKYFLLLMGLFSAFNGFIYNDFASIPLKVFGNSCWNNVYTGQPHGPPNLKDDCVYPVGVDSSWYLGTNELTYLNSLKMKLSVILGVS